jgi:hypothetical protein
MAYIKRIAFRHLHAIKVQTIGTLGMMAKARLSFDLREWLGEQAPFLIEHLPNITEAEWAYESHQENTNVLGQNYSLLINSALYGYESTLVDDPDMQSYFEESHVSSSISDHAAEDYYGSDLAGAWDLEGFIVRSSIVLTLSVLEEFERGVIRILSNFGSTEPALVRKERLIPRLEDYKSLSPEWERLKRSMHTISGRHRALRQYCIEPTPNEPWLHRLVDVRKHRNDIAHGIGAPAMELGKFISIHYDVWRAICHISTEAIARQNILL